MADKKAVPASMGQQPQAQAYIQSNSPYQGQYAAMYQQAANQAMGAGQLYPAPPPSYEQAINHPSMNATTAQQQQQQNSAWVYAAAAQQMYAANYQAAAAAAAAQNYQQLQASGYTAYAPAYYSVGYPAYAAAAQQQRQTIMMPAGYDAGARFDGVSQPVVPPAPPGVAPNAAQLAAMSGQTVVLGQKKGNFVTGSSDGGFTFW